MNSGTLSLSYQVFALFDMLQRAPITIGITVTSEAPYILPISNARSWNFFTFSSSVLMMFWSAGIFISIWVHFCVFCCCCCCRCFCWAMNVFHPKIVPNIYENSSALIVKQAELSTPIWLVSVLHLESWMGFPVQCPVSYMAIWESTIYQSSYKLAWTSYKSAYTSP